MWHRGGAGLAPIIIAAGLKRRDKIRVHAADAVLFPRHQHSGQRHHCDEEGVLGKEEGFRPAKVPLAAATYPSIMTTENLSLSRRQFHHNHHRVGISSFSFHFRVVNVPCIV